MTRTFCEQARYFQPHNGARIDAIRDEIDRAHPDGPLRPILLTALLLAADRVDSTTGLQMAYLKQWSPRSHQPLELRVPELLPGPGRTVRGDAMMTVDRLDPVDLMYLDPPYNQHRYFTNYHVWETLVRWDAPEHYGVACKRVDARTTTRPAACSTASWRCRRRWPTCSAGRGPTCWSSPTTTSRGSAPTTWSPRCATPAASASQVLAFDTKRYVGAQIGIHGPTGVKVGEVKRLRNVEYLFLAGDRDRVAAARSCNAELLTLNT